MSLNITRKQSKFRVPLTQDKVLAVGFYRLAHSVSLWFSLLFLHHRSLIAGLLTAQTVHRWKLSPSCNSLESRSATSNPPGDNGPGIYNLKRSVFISFLISFFTSFFIWLIASPRHLWKSVSRTKNSVHIFTKIVLSCMATSDWLRAQSMTSLYLSLC